MKQTEEMEELLLVLKGWLKKGYLLYLYFSYATNKYECKPIDPVFLSKIELKNFRSKYTANYKLHDNVEDILSDRQKLNNNLENSNWGFQVL